MNARVFMLERPRRQDLDFSTALEFGTLHYIFHSRDSRSALFDVDRFADDVAGSLHQQGFRPDEDFFCVTGSVVGLVNAVFAILREYGRVRVLMYHAPTGRYESRVLDIGDKTYARGTAVEAGGRK